MPSESKASDILGWPTEGLPAEVADALNPSNPDSFRPLVADVAGRMQVLMDYPAVVVALGLAGAVNR